MQRADSPPPQPIQGDSAGKFGLYWGLSPPSALRRRELEQIQLRLGHASVQTTERYFGTNQNLVHAPNDAIKLTIAIRREKLQDLLDRKALGLGSSMVKHLRWFLNAIFKLALSDGLVLNNPAGELRIPKKCQPGRAMRSLTEEEVQDYLSVFDLREKLISRLAIFEGMRPGEILALRWKAVRNGAASVEKRVYKRVFDKPKNGKTREVALSDGPSELLKEWRDLAEDPNPEGFVFPSETLITPLSADNLWRRTMQPQMEKIGLGWATVKVLRKTNASLSKKYGVDPKVSSDQRGHGIGVSMEVYTSSDLEQKREGVNRTRSRCASKTQADRP
jgi:integrase